jgi:hypothetical protein
LAISYLNYQNPNSVVTAAVNFAVKLANFGITVSKYDTGFEEKDAIYNLKVEGIYDELGFSLDQKAWQSSCGVYAT